MTTAIPRTPDLDWAALRRSWSGPLPCRVSFDVLERIAAQRDSTRCLHRTVALVLATCHN